MYCIRRKNFSEKKLPKATILSTGLQLQNCLSGQCKDLLMLHETPYLKTTELDVKSQAASHKENLLWTWPHRGVYTFCSTQNSILMLTYQETFFGSTEALPLNNPVVLILQGFCALTAAKVLCYHHCKSSGLSLLQGFSAIPSSHQNCLWLLLHLHCKVKRYQRRAARKKQA